MSIDTVGSWRELDDAVAAASGPAHAHSPLVFRGLPRSTTPTSRASPGWAGDFALAGAPPDPQLPQVRAPRGGPGRRSGTGCRSPSTTGCRRGCSTGRSRRSSRCTSRPRRMPRTRGSSGPSTARPRPRAAARALRAVLSEEGATVFTAEMLAEHAATLDALDGVRGEHPFVLFFEPPSLDERIVNQSARPLGDVRPAPRHRRVARASTRTAGTRG